jgi:hypothetical protein
VAAVKERDVGYDYEAELRYAVEDLSKTDEELTWSSVAARGRTEDAAIRAVCAKPWCKPFTDYRVRLETRPAIRKS